MNISFSTNDDKNDFLYSNGPQNNGILQLFNKNLFSRANLLSIENGLLEKFDKTISLISMIRITKSKYVLISIVMEMNY